MAIYVYVTQGGWEIAVKYVSISPILCDNINGYLCLCNPGWMGDSCEIPKYLTYSLW